MTLREFLCHVGNTLVPK